MSTGSDGQVVLGKLGQHYLVSPNEMGYLQIIENLTKADEGNETCNSSIVPSKRKQVALKKIERDFSDETIRAVTLRSFAADARKLAAEFTPEEWPCIF